MAEGNPDFVTQGRAVAFDGHKATCGATVRSSATNIGSS
ncbi:PAAR domain-containing protein [Trinickia symbiotica]|nr:hypothetical protein [Trinickia symbiotica]